MMDGSRSLKNATFIKVFFFKHLHSSCAEIFFTFQFDSEANGSLEQYVQFCYVHILYGILFINQQLQTRCNAKIGGCIP
jgi:hypothetical protein